MENSKLPVGKIMMGLVSRGIIVRDYTDAKGLQGEYLRITVSTVEDNANFIKGIHELLEV